MRKLTLTVLLAVALTGCKGSGSTSADHSTNATDPGVGQVTAAGIRLDGTECTKSYGYVTTDGDTACCWSSQADAEDGGAQGITVGPVDYHGQPRDLSNLAAGIRLNGTECESESHAYVNAEGDTVCCWSSQADAADASIRNAAIGPVDEHGKARSLAVKADLR